MTSLASKVVNDLEKSGYRACITSVDRLCDLEAEYLSYTQRAVWKHSPHLRQHQFQFQPPPTLKNARSIITVAAPVAPVKLCFEYQGHYYPVDAPPLSTDFERDLDIVIGIIKKVISVTGYRLVEANVPTKLIASHAGLLENGLNNMGYITGLGSFLRLTAFFSDMSPCEAMWGDHQISPTCRDCGACVEICPTDCLQPEQFDVSRCLSLLSKEPFDFPDWIESHWHNAIIGCRICQLVCPMNRSVVDNVTIRAEFTEAETSAILSGTTFKILPANTREKLRWFHLDAYYEVLPRNLRLLLSSKQEKV